mmetsp:Transcript_47370/g.119956  ORF Transcript_47370/g.119956 Transcript_47370/m.119956 type:complete len:263 (-) Transcript_47370:73-861(-)
MIPEPHIGSNTNSPRSMLALLAMAHATGCDKPVRPKLDCLALVRSSKGSATISNSSFTCTTTSTSKPRSATCQPRFSAMASPVISEMPLEPRCAMALPERFPETRKLCGSPSRSKPLPTSPAWQPSQCTALPTAMPVEEAEAAAKVRHVARARAQPGASAMWAASASSACIPGKSRTSGISSEVGCFSTTAYSFSGACSSWKALGCNCSKDARKKTRAWPKRSKLTTLRCCRSSSFMSRWMSPPPLPGVVRKNSWSNSGDSC